MNELKKIMGLTITLLLMGMIIQPAAAWGELAHIVIVSKITPNTDMRNNPKYLKGGSIGPDLFYYSTYSLYSDRAHTEKTSQLPREMMNIISSSTTYTEFQKSQYRAYVDGWWSHYESDIIGHRDYVNTFDPSLHYDVEAGVDANLFRQVSDYSFYVPYGLIQISYANVYSGDAPSSTIIRSAASNQQTAIFIERTAIALGLLNTQKELYDDFWNQYRSSISESANAINDPPTTDYNLNTGFEILTPSISSSSVSVQRTKEVREKDIIDTAKELLAAGTVEVTIEDDKVNQVFLVKEPYIKNKKKFDEAIEKLAAKKKGKK